MSSVMAATLVKFTLCFTFQFWNTTVQIKLSVLQYVQWFVLLAAQSLCLNYHGEFACEEVLALNVNDQMTFRCAHFFSVHWRLQTMNYKYTLSYILPAENEV